MNEQVAPEEQPWNFERKPDESPTVLAWKLDALNEKVEKLTVPVKEAVSAAMAGLRAAMESRKPEDVKDYAEDEERILIPVRFLESLSRNARGPGSVNGPSKTLTVLVAINTALLIGIGGWLLFTVQRHDTDIAVIKCQLNPQICQQVFRDRS